MAAILDTGPLITALDRTEPHHARFRRLLSESLEPLILSPFVLLELDQYVLRHLGPAVEAQMLRDIAGGIGVAALSDDEVARCADLIEQHADLRIGLADASIVVLAARHGTTRVVTQDQRHFRAMRSLGGEPFVLLPWDEGQRDA